MEIPGTDSPCPVTPKRASVSSRPQETVCPGLCRLHGDSPSLLSRHDGVSVSRGARAEALASSPPLLAQARGHVIPVRAPLLKAAAPAPVGRAPLPSQLLSGNRRDIRAQIHHPHFSRMGKPGPKRPTSSRCELTVSPCRLSLETPSGTPLPPRTALRERSGVAPDGACLQGDGSDPQCRRPGVRDESTPPPSDRGSRSTSARLPLISSLRRQLYTSSTALHKAPLGKRLLSLSLWL